ncbi:MAG: hypothetical protein K0S71_557 [Clostridia bacterium]|nr:hypothetical protein [Clostridia bacterium]
MRSDPYLLALLNGAGLSLDDMDAYIADIAAQLNVSTATWSLDIYEREAGIKTNKSRTYEERRAVIVARWRSSGKSDIHLIQQVADAWKNGRVNVEFRADGQIHVTFNSEKGVPSDLDSLDAAIDEVKPAHLGVIYHFLYLLIRDVHGMKINTLQGIKLNAFAMDRGQ